MYRQSWRQDAGRVYRRYLQRTSTDAVTTRMDFAIPPEEAALADEIGLFARNVLSGRAAQIDASGDFPEANIRELAELIAEATGYDGSITWDTSKPNGQPRRSVDASRARELFGFEASTELRDGIERTVAWYRSNRTTRVGR